jgi:hypothetical protein
MFKTTIIEACMSGWRCLLLTTKSDEPRGLESSGNRLSKAPFEARVSGLFVVLIAFDCSKKMSRFYNRT